jgi:enamine deaminase RidA (YjgF/YER057c/UK114 family)
VIAIAGTNGLNDWDDNLSFITGDLSEQFQQALTYSSILLKALGYLSLSEVTKTWYSLLATMALAPGASKVTPFKPKV